MRPKGKLFALLAVFMAIAVVAATGAFTTVSAERTAQVNVTGDSSALIGLNEGADNPGYVSSSGGTVEISLSAGSGSGVNENATTEIDRMLNISNNGERDVYLTIHRIGDNPSVVSFHNATASTAYVSNITNGSISSQTNTVRVNSGEKIQVSMKIDTTNTEFDVSSNDINLIRTIEIEATDVNQTS